MTRIFRRFTQPVLVNVKKDMFINYFCVTCQPQPGRAHKTSDVILVNSMCRKECQRRVHEHSRQDQTLWEVNVS
jgi:hypothetical protein